MYGDGLFVVLKLEDYTQQSIYVIDIVEFTLYSMFMLINFIFTTQSYLYVDTLEVFCNEAL